MSAPEEPLAAKDPQKSERPERPETPSMPSVETLAAGVLAGDRALLARAITLIESRHPAQVERAQELLERLLPATGGAHRIGISGVPGVGKSTFIDALGLRLVEAGHRVAVLAVDPSSTVSGGSILGDKSRMPRLARRQESYIRPSPSAQSVGGVTRSTREALLLCEAAGFDIVLVETVGVGQSETVVSDMVDLFLVLMLPGAGDELQGIKKGILELADLIAVNKADGDRRVMARQAAADYNAALRYLRPQSASWRPQAVVVSAETGDGLDDLWSLIEKHRAKLTASGEFEDRRRRQSLGWMWSSIDDRLLESFRAHPEVRRRLAEVEADVLAGRTTPSRAAEELLAAFSDPSSSAPQSSTT